MAEPSTSDDKRVGRYRLLERLAVGGMSEVFLAAERGAYDFERVVVIKKMLPHLADDPSFVDMFLREARIAARINHPNVVQIIELAEEAGAPFIAMEYVDGATLRELMVMADERRLFVPVGVAVHLAAQAIAGAHAVHELKDPDGKAMSLVHRDISPHNLMVDHNAHVKLLDFGIVKSGEGEKTRTGVLKGKLAYMSPEQCRQDDVDLRTDVYALGVVLWELFAGEKMMPGGNEFQLMQAVIRGEIRDLLSVRKDVPKVVAAVVHKALATDRKQRFASADELRRALLDAAAAAGISTDPDVARDFVRDMLGARFEKRKAALREALKRGDTTFTKSKPTSSGTAVTSSAGTRVATYGAVGALGALVSALGIAGVAFIAALLLFLGVLLWQSGVRLPEPPEPVPDGEPVVFVFAPTIDGGTIISELEPLRKYLVRKLNRPVRFTVGKSYAETLDEVAKGRVDFASLTPYLVVLAERDAPTVEVLVVKQFDGSSGTDGVLLVREDAAYADPKDLKGARICYSDRTSTTGYLLPRRYLREHGIDPEKDMGGVHVSGNHHQVIRDVTAGVCDVGGTFSGAYTSGGQVGVNVSKVRVFDLTGRTPHDAIASGPATDPALASAVRDALLGFQPERDTGVSVLGKVQRLSGFVAPQDDAYLALQAAVEAEAKHEPK